MVSRPIFLSALSIVLFGFLPSIAKSQVQQIWLTHRSNEPGWIVINWTTDQPGNSIVHFGLSDQYGNEARIDDNSKLHHVEIPLKRQDTTYHYRVQTGDQISPDATFKAYPTDVLRVVIAADWQRTPDLTAIIDDDPHLLLTAGDHIWNFHELCGSGSSDCIAPYVELIDRYPKLFRSTPFMPVLGNHDKQIHPRGSEPPEEQVYDIQATAYRRFFELPDDEWKWRFDVPGFDVRFVALDLHHINDMGTTWQASNPFGENSEQFRWYDSIMKDHSRRFVITLYNERNARIRTRENGAWHGMISRGTLAISGFGYYAERAETTDGFTYYNTALSSGDIYPDPESKYLAAEGSYILLTITKHPPRMMVDIKNLEGKVLDRKEYR